MVRSAVTVKRTVGRLTNATLVSSVMDPYVVHLMLICNPKAAKDPLVYRDRHSNIVIVVVVSCLA